MCFGTRCSELHSDVILLLKRIPNLSQASKPAKPVFSMVRCPPRDTQVTEGVFLGERFSRPLDLYADEGPSLPDPERPERRRRAGEAGEVDRRDPMVD